MQALCFRPFGIISVKGPMPGLRFQHFYLIRLLCLSEKMSPLEKCNVFLADRSVVSAIGLQTFSWIHTNPRILKAAGPPVWLLSSCSEKAGQVPHPQPPCVLCAQLELPLPVLAAVLLRATVSGNWAAIVRFLPQRCVESCAGSSRGVPAAGPRLWGAHRAGEQRVLGCEPEPSHLRCLRVAGTRHSPSRLQALQSKNSSRV